MIAITGATGLLGGYLVAELGRRDVRTLALGGPSRGGAGIDLRDLAGLSAVFASERPDVVIHTAAMSAMADCVRDPGLARSVNVDGTANVARAADQVGARLVYLSTDLVFDGEQAPYDEQAPTNPTSVYGTTKRDGELAALSAARAVVVRVSLLFGPTRTSRRGFFDQQIETLRAGAPMTLFDDEWRTPLSLRSAAEGLVEIARSELGGTLHLGGPERMTRHEMGVRLAEVVKARSSDGIARASRTSIGGEPRPRDVSLDSSTVRRAFPSLAFGSFEAECERMLRERSARSERSERRRKQGSA